MSNLNFSIKPVKVKTGHFKKKLDQFLCNLDDKPCTPHFDNSVVHVTKCDTNFVSC